MTKAWARVMEQQWWKQIMTKQLLIKTQQNAKIDDLNKEEWISSRTLRIKTREMSLHIWKGTHNKIQVCKRQQEHQHERKDYQNA
jgi:hypothetical protein